LDEAERVSDDDLKAVIDEVLSDRPRSGGRCKFTAEQFTQIIALACEDPQDSGYPVTHWTAKEITQEAIRRKIVDKISVRHVGRFLKGGRFKTAQDAVLDDLQGQTGRPRRLSASG
jgi:putative transposase